MRAILVGCGAMADGWLKAIQHSPLLRDRIELVALVDLDISAGLALADKFGLDDILVTDNLEKTLHRVKPDVVFDVAVPGARPMIVRQALIAGLHVLSEKPMAPSLQEAQELAALADSKNRLYTIVQNRRYKAGIRRAQQFLASGAIGDVTGLHADFFIGAHFGGFRDQMDHVLLLDMAIHTFDAARFLSGSEPLAVQCIETNPKGSWYKHGPSAFATFEMSEGVMFTYRGSWCAEGANTSWDSQWRITGSTGTLLWDGEEEFRAQIGVGENSFLREVEALSVPPLCAPDLAQEHASVIHSFLTAIENSHRAETDSSDNLKSIAMVFAAIQSAQQNRPIDINLETSPA